MDIDRTWLTGIGTDHPVVAAIAQRFPDAELVEGHFRGEIIWIVQPEGLIEFMTYLRDEPSLAFKFLIDVGGLEVKQGDIKLWTFYNIHSLQNRVRMRIKVPAKNGKVPSVTPLFPGANWHEREAYDMFGIQFDGHPDLTRIFMPDEFEGHPLRKDFPLRGRDRD